MASNMSNLLKWSIENSNPNAPNGEEPAQPEQRSNLNPELLAQLFGGPSDADLMRDSMAAIRSPDVDLENRLVAFDNFEQLVENLDNANNMEALGLWTPLVEQLESGEAEIRMMAAWCCGTAVQNNVKSQERMHVLGAIPILARLAVDDPDQQVRRKAILALSSGIRNYQPGLDSALGLLDPKFTGLTDGAGAAGQIDAGDMEAIDAVVSKLREHSAQRG